jgi:hypothetical protein
MDYVDYNYSSILGVAKNRLLMLIAFHCFTVQLLLLIFILSTCRLAIFLILFIVTGTTTKWTL